MSTKRRSIWTFVITSVALFMASLDNLVVTMALPSIREHLHASLEGLQWTVNAYTLTFAVLLLTGAALGDRFGRRRVYVCGIALFIAASAACALAPNVPALIVARTLIDEGCRHFGVATLDEGRALRDAGVRARVYLQAGFFAEQAVEIVALDLTPFVFDAAMIGPLLAWPVVTARWLRRAARPARAPRSRSWVWCR